MPPWIFFIFMPELPEVEVTRRSFAQPITGAVIRQFQMGKPLRWPLGCSPEKLIGKQITSVRRRGKYLLIDLNQGLLMVHLGMSGSLRFAPQLGPLQTHDHMDMVTSQGTLRLHDPRRFGAVVYVTGESSLVAQKLLGHLGVEPLDDGFDPLDFYRALQTKKTAIKQVLLHGDVVVGIGNIYASEALFRAGIRPTLSAQKISKPRVQRLHQSIRDVLHQAVKRGGSTLNDFTNAHGEQGQFQLEAMVYDRQGMPCRICKNVIKKIVQGQRATYYCSACQKN